jgi:flagellar motor switch protein FliN/FliY
LPLAELGVGEDGAILLLVAVAPGLSSVAAPVPEPAAPHAPDPGRSAPSAPAATNPAAPGPVPSSVPANIQVLYDVELPVAVSFGRAFLALKEVLKLTSGSIVELNRTVTETVDVIVNNCVIARGEVVVVEGNYGVRITEIVSRNERLQSVH